MPNKQELADALASAEERIRELEIETAGRVVYRKDRKLKPYKPGEDNMEDWIKHVSSYIMHYSTETEKVQTVMELLDKKSRTLVNFHCMIDDCTVRDVFNALLPYHKPAVTAVQLQQEFFTRNQKPKESNSDYIQALMELAIKVRDKDNTLLPDLHAAVKEKFADGVTDPTLKRELKRLNDERSDLQLSAMLDRADKWLLTGVTSKPVSTSEAAANNEPSSGEGATASGASEDLASLVKQQKQEIESLKKQLGAKSKVCYYCNRNGHLQNNCFKKMHDEAQQNSQNPTTVPTRGHPNYRGNRGHRGRRFYRGRGRGYRNYHETAEVDEQNLNTQ